MNTTEPLNSRRIPLAHGGGTMPAVGFGTLIADPVAARRAIVTALQAGYRLLDGAELYRNEEVVGAALREAFDAGTLRREELFVTSKLWNNNHRPERVRPALLASLRRLGLDVLDLYLVHTPYAFQPGDTLFPVDAQGGPVYDSGVSLAETWGAMERLVDEGLVKAIGLSDITLDKLEAIVAVARIKPAVVQVESHPFLPEWELLEFCRRHGIVLQAFAPLGHGMKPGVVDEPVIQDIARRTGQSPAQVALAWAVQRGGAVLSTSTNAVRIRENFAMAPLPEEAMREIRENIGNRVRFNAVVATGVPGFVPQVKAG